MIRRRDALNSLRRMLELKQSRLQDPSVSTQGRVYYVTEVAALKYAIAAIEAQRDSRR